MNQGPCFVKNTRLSYLFLHNYSAGELVWVTCMMVYVNNIEVDANIFTGLSFTDLTDVFQSLIDGVNIFLLWKIYCHAGK